MIKRSSTRARKAPVTAPAETIVESPKRRIPIIPILAFGGLIALAAGFFVVRPSFFAKGSPAVGDIQVRDGVDSRAVGKTVERVRALTVTNPDEMPTIATIQDVSILRPQNPALYRDADNGDQLLVWSDKVVVYSATRDKVLVVMPINLPPPVTEAPAPAEAPAETPVVEAAPTVEVRNATGRPGAARVLTEALEKEGFKTLAAVNAAGTYPKTTITVADGKSFPQNVARLQGLTGGSVASMPAGEAATKADIVIILGSAAD